MDKRKTRKPLTDEQRKLVEDNVKLAYEFVHKKGFKVFSMMYFLTAKITKFSE